MVYAVASFENDCAIELAENLICTNRTKHIIDIQYHFVRKVANQTVRMVYGEFEKQVADSSTKHLPKAFSVRHRKTLLSMCGIMLHSRRKVVS